MTVDQITNTTVPDATKAEKINEVIGLVDEVLNNPNLSDMLGPIESRLPTLRESTADVEAKAATLKSLLTLENMGIMKGVLSDSDMKVIAQASSSLNERGSVKAYKAELNKIKAKMQARLNSPARPAAVAPSEAAPQGQIWVADKNGDVGALPEGEYDPKLYTKL
jgi:hypothetical protein